MLNLCKCGCGELTRAPNFIHGHNRRGFQKPLERIWSLYIRQPNGCLEYQGHRDEKGYGRFAIGKSNEPAHRIIWKLLKGPIPAGIQVCHHCDNPPCGDIAHLFLGTNHDNVIDSVKKERRASKLSGMDIEQIRHIGQSLKLSQQAIADKFGVTQGQISRILRQKVWVHVI